MDNNEIQSKTRPTMGERIHEFFASYNKNPIVDGVIVGAMAAAFGAFGGPIASARAFGGGLIGALSTKYLADRASEIRNLRKKVKEQVAAAEAVVKPKVEMPIFDIPVSEPTPKISEPAPTQTSMPPLEELPIPPTQLIPQSPLQLQPDFPYPPEPPTIQTAPKEPENLAA